MTQSQPRLAVVGGSIAGCAAAVLFHRAGWKVTVFERAREELLERGAGINIFAPDLQRFVEAGLIDPDIPTCRVGHYQFRWRAPQDPERGRIVGSHQVDSYALHWGDLYQNLRRRVPHSCYRSGSEVLEVRGGDTGATVVLADGTRRDVDLVLAADGYASLGRQLLFPRAALEYAGIVAWRGLLPESALCDPQMLNETLAGVGMPSSLSVFYYVPGAGGARPGQRLVNWLVYQPVPEPDLPDCLTGSDGLVRANLVPPGYLRDEQVAQFNALARRELPGNFADICVRSRDTFAQAIYQGAVPGYARGRVCLLGDAGALASPASAAGALKAMEDALSLDNALSQPGKLDDKLDHWSHSRSTHGNYLSRLGRHRVRAMILASKDWGAMDSAAFSRWFEAANNLDEG